MSNLTRKDVPSTGYAAIEALKEMNECNPMRWHHGNWIFVGKIVGYSYYYLVGDEYLHIRDTTTSMSANMRYLIEQDDDSNYILSDKLKM